MSLKNEWLERIKIINKRDVFSKNGRFTVKTDFYEAPEEIRNDPEMCFKVIIDSEEFLWNIPTEIKTPEFLTKLMNAGCKQNLLESLHFWDEKYYNFIIDYANHKKQNNENVQFDQWIYDSPLFKNRDYVLKFVNLGILNNKNILQKFHKDKEIMTAWIDNHPSNFPCLLKSIKKHYLKDKIKIFKLLDYSPQNYTHFPDKIQAMDDVNEYAIKQDGYILGKLPEEIRNNKEKILQYVKNCPNLHGDSIPESYKNDFDIAKTLIERNGCWIRFFKISNPHENEELIKLANKTYKYINIIPFEKKYEELIIETVLTASKSENDSNFSYISASAEKINLIKHLMLPLYLEDKISKSTIIDFFNKKLYASNETFSTHRKTILDKEVKNDILHKDLLFEFVKIDSYFFEKTNPTYAETDYSYLYLYIQRCIQENKDYISKIPFSIKMQAKTEGVDIENYILKKNLEQTLHNSLHKKIKI